MSIKPTSNSRIVAVGLLTEQDLQVLGPAFNRVWAIDETPCFNDLLLAIDEADRSMWRERDSADIHPSDTK